MVSLSASVAATVQLKLSLLSAGLGLRVTVLMIGAEFRTVTLVSVNGPDEVPSSGVTLTVQVSSLLVAVSGTAALAYDVL